MRPNLAWLCVFALGCSEYEVGSFTNHQGNADEAFAAEDPADAFDTSDTGSPTDTTDEGTDDTGTIDSAPPDTEEPPPPQDTGTPEVDTEEPPPPPDTGDEPPPPPQDACLESEDMYNTNPAARLVVTDGSAPITVSYIGSSTSYVDELWLDSPYVAQLAVTGETAIGSVVATGVQPAGTELLFGIQVRNTGYHYQSGPESRNADGVTHVAVTYEGNCSWVIGFEDLWGGGDRDYNDVELRITGRLRQD